MQDKLEQRAFLLLLAIVTLLFLYLIQPFFGAIFWACVIAIIFYPVQKRLTRLWGKRRNLTALTTLLLCFTIVILPTLFVVGSFIREGVQLYRRIEEGEIDPEGFLARIGETIPYFGAIMDRAGINVENIKEQSLEFFMEGGQYFAQHAFTLGHDTVLFFLHFALMLYLAFFFLREGESLRHLVSQALPLGQERKHMLLHRFAEVTRATVKGNILIAIIEGALGGLIFWILGLPAPILWGVVMAVLSLIPAVGAGLIWLPAAIYLLAVGDVMEGVILIAYGSIVIGMVDYLLRPILVSRDTGLPDYMILLSTLGGLLLFGVNGFVVGPLIAALFMAFWGIFIREFNHKEPAGKEG